MKNKLVLVLCLSLVVAFSPIWGVVSAASPRLQSPQIPVYAPTASDDFLNIPTIAFLPIRQDYDYHQTGRIITANGSSATFRAPVILPNYSTLVSVTACFYDDTLVKTATLKLYNSRLDDADDDTEMASISSTTTSDYTTVSDTTISPVANNNSVFTYWLTLTLPASSGEGDNVYFCGASIEYIRTQPSYNILSIPGAAFDRPFEDGYNLGHIQGKGKLIHYHTPAGDVPGTYLAPVSLPDGAVVTKMTVYYQDDNVGAALNGYLERSYLGSSTDMAAASSADSGYKTDDTTIANAVIDNYNYSYWAYVYLPSTNISLWAVTIEYTPPAYEDDWLAIAPAAFTGAYEDYDYENHGRWLFHLHNEGGGSGDGVYSAPVQLPQGARMDGLWATFYCGDSPRDGNAYLMRSRRGTSTSMGDVTISPSGGYSTGIDSSISNNVVDNSQYNYYVQFVLPVSSVPSPPGAGDMIGVKILIQFTNFHPVYLPVIRKN